MEFGKIEPKELSKVDFTFRKEPVSNTKILESGSKKKPKVFVGCAKWGRKDWVGKIYPKGTKEADFLDHYAKHFNSIELNATFYQLWPKETVAKWANKAGKDFLFCPKFYQGISHWRRLKSAERETDSWLSSVFNFGNKLGPAFLQMPDSFGPKDLAAVESYIKSLPKDLDFFMEVRHKDWYTEENSKKLFDLLSENKVGAVITDAAGRRDCVHMHLTNKKTFIRFVGNGLHRSDYERVDKWVLKIRDWLKAGISEVYFFMHQHNEIHSPELARYTVLELNKKCGLDLKVPEFTGGNGLFN